ncbi:MAG: winged helix-turn-helix domain-containing protein [Firmicutes bacterium]|nr:winged helix-turn-helix domain-containing protein [Bacillota bacterium]
MILNQAPSEIGFPAESNWTAGLVVKYIKREYGLDHSIRGTIGILDRLGLSYTRSAAYVLANTSTKNCVP